MWLCPRCAGRNDEEMPACGVCAALRGNQPSAPVEPGSVDQAELPSAGSPAGVDTSTPEDALPAELYSSRAPWRRGTVVAAVLGLLVLGSCLIERDWGPDPPIIGFLLLLGCPAFALLGVFVIAPLFAMIDIGLRPLCYWLGWNRPPQ